jgi:general secretion pathway protein F
MERFQYQILLEGGKSRGGTIRAVNRREALKTLVRQGQHPLRVDSAGENNAGTWGASWLPFRHVKTSDLSVFTRQLAMLTKAGLSMAQALRTVRQQCANRLLVRAVQEIEESVAQHGGTLADAMDDHSHIFDPVYRGIVRAGEESGNIVEVLMGLSTHLAERAKLRGQVIGAFVYPVFLLLLGAAAVFVLMSFVVPKFQDIFAEFGANLPMATRVLIGLSGFMEQWWWAALCACGAGLLILLALLRKASVRRQVDAGLLRLPLIGVMSTKLEVLRIAQTLSALLHSGLPILEALRITGNTVKNSALRGVFPAIIDGVREGKALAEVTAATGLFPSLAINVIRTGEDTGELVAMLDELTAIYEEESQRAVTGMLRLLEPVLIVTIGIVIATIVAAVMLPIFQINTLLK